MKGEEIIDKKLLYLSSLNEVDSRNYLGLWAIELGWGGVSKINTIGRPGFVFRIPLGEYIASRDC